MVGDNEWQGTMNGGRQRMAQDNDNNNGGQQQHDNAMPHGCAMPHPRYKCEVVGLFFFSF
jgi:hypothetical protein